MMLETEREFLDEVLELKRLPTSVPNEIPTDLIESITTRELVDLLNNFSFSAADVALDDNDSMFSITVNLGNIIFFSNPTWNANSREDHFGVMVTLPVAFETDFISKFNQNTKIGRLYTLDSNAESTMFRSEVHLCGGVSQRHIYFKIKTFIDCFQHLYAGVLSAEAAYEQ